MTANWEAMRDPVWPPGDGAAREWIRGRASRPGGEWPPALRAAVDAALASGFPGLVLWDGGVRAPSPAAIPNEAALRLLGAGPERIGQPLHEAWPEAWSLVRPLAEDLRRPGAAPMRRDAWLAPPQGGAPVRLLLSLGPLHEGRRVAGFLLGLVPAAEEQALLRAVPHLVWRTGDGGRCLWAGPQWCAFTGQTEGEARGLGWLKALHAEDRAAALAAWRRAGDGVPFEIEARLCRAGQAEPRWFRLRAVPLRRGEGPDGGVGEGTEWLGIATDVDGLRRAERRQRDLLAEMQHRARNTMAVIRSIIRRTVQASLPAEGRAPEGQALEGRASEGRAVEELAMHLDGRVDAFARVQAAINRDPASGLDLAQTVADELLAHAAREDRQVALHGPPVQLRAKAGETLALAVHELTANAVKYGALSVPEGVVRVAWRIEEGAEGRRLVLVWAESGGPPVRAPARRGFGTDLLERGLPYDLQAEVRQDFAPDGLRCTIALPCAEWVLPGGHPPEEGGPPPPGAAARGPVSPRRGGPPGPAPRSRRA